MESTLQIIGSVVSILSLLGVGTLAKLFWEDKYGKKARKRAEQEEYKQKMLQDEIRKIVKEELIEVKSKIGELKSSDDREDNAIQAILRDRLYQISNVCLEKGYTTQQERDNFENLYEKYHDMGKNGCMNLVRDKFFELPTQEAYNKQ